MNNKSGKMVLVDGELVPLEDLQNGKETRKQREERQKAVAEEKAEREKFDNETDMSDELDKARKEILEQKRAKYIRTLIKAKVPVDPNIGHDEAFELVKKHKLADEDGALTKEALELEGKEEPKITQAEAKLRSDLQGKLMDNDVDCDLVAETEVLQATWAKFLEEEKKKRESKSKEDGSKDSEELQSDEPESNLEKDNSEQSEDSSEQSEESVESKEEIKKRLDKEAKEKLIAEIKELDADSKVTKAWGIPKLEKELSKLKSPNL